MKSTAAIHRWSAQRLWRFRNKMGTPPDFRGRRYIGGGTAMSLIWPYWLII